MNRHFFLLYFKCSMAVILLSELCWLSGIMFQWRLKSQRQTEWSWLSSTLSKSDINLFVLCYHMIHVDTLALYNIYNGTLYLDMTLSSIHNLYDQFQKYQEWWQQHKNLLSLLENDSWRQTFDTCLLQKLTCSSSSSAFGLTAQLQHAVRLQGICLYAVKAH